MAEPGAYVMREIGGESFFVIRGDGELRGFFNVCRHRGARILSECGGRSAPRSLPYHAWSYGLDGSLPGHPPHREPRCLRPRHHGLSPVAVGVVGGNQPTSPRRRPRWAVMSASSRDGSSGTAGPLEPGGRRDYEVRANWKAIAENYNECLHCPGVHAELNAFRLRERRGGRGRRRVVRRLDDA